MESFERPLIFGIESSCDDTACAVLDGAGRILASVVSSQIKAHQPYGGVVPEIASREHLSNWPAVSGEALSRAGIEIQDVDAVAATRGPGLIGCLLVGLSLGRAMALALGKDFHGVHHLEGHLYSSFLDPEARADPIPESFLGLIISGGHTSLLDVVGGGVTTLIETRDDAMGEVFDKVGKRLGLSFPQGPQVDLLAEDGNPDRFRFTVPKVQDELFFSYSGLKSQALREIEKLESHGLAWNADDPPQEALDLLAGFRHAAVGQILHRLERYHRSRPISTLAVSGGVAANRLLRRQLELWSGERGVDLRLVPLVYSGDNAAMIAFAGLVRQRRGLVDDPRDAVVASRIPFRAA